MARRVTIITTGGTIEKTYDERTGELENRRSILGRMLRRVRLADCDIEVVELMSKDSLLMTADDRERILKAVKDACADSGGGRSADGVVILHGTDTLGETGELLCASIGSPRVAIALTGAFRPFEMRLSDALQNLTEAILSVGILEPGVYCVLHGRALEFPGVVKDRDAGTFRMRDGD